MNLGDHLVGSFRVTDFVSTLYAWHGGWHPADTAEASLECSKRVPGPVPGGAAGCRLLE